MTEGEKRPEKREPLKDIPVGSGMTAGTRPPAITDQPYRDKVERGALVDSRVRMSADESFYTLRWRCERFCKEAFEAEGLPDPFSFIHLNGKQHPLEGHIVTGGGEAEVARVHHVGYRLAAVELAPPSEDHTDLCYASRMARIITRLDILKADADNRPETRAALILSGAQFGSALGRLAAEKGLTDKWQSAVDHGQQFPAGRTDAANEARERAKEHHEKQVIDLAQRLLKEGGYRRANNEINRSALAEGCERASRIAGGKIRYESARKIISAAIKQGDLV